MRECPFCGGRYEAFLPYGADVPVLRHYQVVGGGPRADVVCQSPPCSSLDRERLVYLFLMHRTELLTSAASVLHVAPEPNLGHRLRHRPIYTAVDLKAEDGVIQMDLAALGFRDSSFDVVICNHVLEHITDDRAALDEIHRVLRPTGWAILQVPISLCAQTTFEDDSVTDPIDRERVFGQDDHVRIYGQDYRDRLESAGYALDVRNAAIEFGDAFCERYGLCKQENLYLCQKSGAQTAHPGVTRHHALDRMSRQHLHATTN
jgi:SAM-dependent methyltransferase